MDEGIDQDDHAAALEDLRAAQGPGLHPVVVTMVVLGTIALFFGLPAYVLGQDADTAEELQVDIETWDRVEATVSATRVFEMVRLEHSSSYCTEFAYRYEVAGEHFGGRRYGPSGEPCMATREQAEALTGRYPAGSRHSIFVNPAAPQEAFLNGEPDAEFVDGNRRVAKIVWVLGTLLAVLAGGAVLYASWAWRRGHSRSFEAQP